MYRVTDFYRFWYFKDFSKITFSVKILVFKLFFIFRKSLFSPENKMSSKLSCFTSILIDFKILNIFQGMILFDKTACF